MTDTPTPDTAEAGPVELTELEQVARLAAEAAARAIAAPPDDSRLLAVEAALREIRAGLQTDATARAALAERLTAIEHSLDTEPAPHAGQQQLIDDLRLKVATLERNSH